MTLSVIDWSGLPHPSWGAVVLGVVLVCLGFSLLVLFIGAWIAFGSGAEAPQVDEEEKAA